MTSTPNLNVRFSVRSRSNTRDARGVRANTYDHKFFLWGETPREGAVSLRAENNAIRSQETVRFRTRFVPNVAVGDQFVHASMTPLYVSSMTDVDGQRKWLQVVATRTPADDT